MQLTAFVSLALASTVLAQFERPKNERLAAELYDSGRKHAGIMEKKESFWAEREAAGTFVSDQYSLKSVFDSTNYIQCQNGTAAAVPGNATFTFRCKNVDLYDFKTHLELGSPLGGGSSSWGWTSEDGREFIVFGQRDGAAFVEISQEGKLVYLGRLPQYSVPSIWREIRVYKDYAVIGSEAVGHNVQIFDLKKLLDIDPNSPVTFSNENDLTSLFTGLPNGQTHNIVINEAKDYAVAVGAKPRTDACAAGLIFIDLADVANPVTPGCNAEDGYVHDAQCIPYKGPDAKYQGRDVCYGYNEDSLTIYDVTDRANSSVISRTSYVGASYTHQGWVLDPENQQFLILDDELDEDEAAGPAADGFATTFIWNITSLENPLQTGYYKSGVRSIDHNQYIHNGYAYQSNYGAGLRVLDIRSIPADPTGAGVSEVAYFDIFPEDDNEEGGGLVQFVGTWSSYALFKSGFIFINTMERGGWVVKRSDIES